VDGKARELTREWQNPARIVGGDLLSRIPGELGRRHAFDLAKNRHRQILSDFKP
jgi:hypothetical protein